jgi:hypothetical protein
VFSIGVTYASTQQVVDRYCKHFDLPDFRKDRSRLPAIESQQSISKFVHSMENLGIEEFAETIFHNRQRTSPRGGILKAEATLHFAQALQRHGVEYLQDAPRAANDRALEAEIFAIPGQSSGISFGYFFMLAGSDDLVKPDRMILRFLKDCLGRPIQAPTARKLLADTAAELRAGYPHLTARLLDYRIWERQRAQEGSTPSPEKASRHSTGARSSGAQ